MAFMDQKFDLHLVEEEEEKSGWTILSTVPDKKLEEAKYIEPDKEPDEFLRVAEGSTLSSEDKSNHEDECSDDAEEVLYSEGDDNGDYELTEYGVSEGGKVEGAPCPSTSARAYVWEPDPIREAIGKQTLVEQQPVQRQGLLWRFSLVATLGLLGWAVLSGLCSGGKNIRCLKMHTCSLKEGEPILSTM